MGMKKKTKLILNQVKGNPIKLGKEIKARSTKVTQVVPEGSREVFAKNEILEGKYCNVAQIQHTPREFIFDFIWGVESRAILTARIITSPAHAKEIYMALGKNIGIYEGKHGGIKISPEKLHKDSLS